MNWKPKFIHLPIDKMAGAPWNLLDHRGFRIAWCGTDGNHEKDGELIANDLLNLVAIGEAAGELLDTATKKLQAAEDRVRELEPYAKFGRMFVEKVGMDAFWWGDEWSEAVMPIAVQAGIAERVPYDPDIHGEGVEAEPGDEIWVWLPLKAQGSGE